MVGILIVGHGGLGESLIHCTSHVLGRMPELLANLGVTAQDDPDEVLPRVQEMIRQLDQGDGVLILSDIYGATPCNIICRLLVPGKIEGISGVNLPMLVRVLNYRNQPLETVVEKALSGGREGILHITMEACDVAA